MLQKVIQLCKFKINFIKTPITEIGLAYLKGVHTIKIACCDKITDAGFAYLKGSIIYKN